MALEIVETIADLRRRVATRRSSGPLGLVPTMGALHDGHASLIRRARDDCATVVVSIFVNPIQFDRPEDLERYPRSLDRDVALCDSLGVDLVFAPSVAEMYPRAARRAESTSEDWPTTCADGFVQDTSAALRRSC